MDRETTAPGLRVELFVSDPGRSAAFYEGALGFQLIRADPSGYKSVGRDGVVIGLSMLDHLSVEHPVRPEAGERLGLGVELVVMVTDVQKAHAAALHAGAADVSPVVRQSWGLTDFRVRDPDGYYIRVTGLSE